VSTEKTFVNVHQFTNKMNDELHRNIDYQAGMEFVENESGLELLAPTLALHQIMALHKIIFDSVSAIYTISK
jgi:hypothetical protein